MKKSDLVAGKHMVQYRNGCFRFVGKNGYLKDDESKVVSGLLHYNEHLKCMGSNDNAFDIVAVYELNEAWKREDPTITEDEKAILRNLPGKYEWIARDESGVLYIYHDKPKKEEFMWVDGFEYKCLNLFSHLFQMVKWEDDEPWNIEDLLKLDVKKS